MDTRNRTWLIVGLDILLVLLVYLLYTHVLRPALLSGGPAKSVSHHEQVKYELEATPEENNTIKLSFRLENTAGETTVIDLPRGVTLMLSDGQKYIYDQQQIISPGELKLGGGAKENWDYRASHPRNPPESIYGGYFLDKSRQKQVRIELSN